MNNREATERLVHDNFAIRLYNETFWYYIDNLPEKYQNDNVIHWIRKAALKAANI